MNTQTKNIIIIIGIIIATFFLTKSCEKQIQLPNINTEIIQKHNQLKILYSNDSIAYNKRIEYLNHQLSILGSSNDTLKENYNNIYKTINSSLEDTIIVKEFVYISNVLVNNQDSIINQQDSIIVEHLDYIDIQEIAILNRDSLLIESNELLTDSNNDLSKSQKKLKRTRKLGIAGIVIGFIGGLIIK